MANLGINFDANQVAPAAPQGAIPADFYLAAITKSEMKVTSKKDGGYLALELTIQAGKYKGRKLFNNLNLNNPNATAVEIAQAELSAICHAVNVMMVTDSVQLHGIPMCVKVGIEPERTEGDKTYPARNVLQGYEPADEYEGEDAGDVILDGGPTDTPAWAAAAETAAPAKAAPSKAPPKAAPSKAPPAKTYVEEKRMTAKADGATYEAFIGNEWTDEEMIKEGYMEIVQVEVAANVTGLPQTDTDASTAPPPWAK